MRVEADLVIRTIERAREDQREDGKAKPVGASAESPAVVPKGDAKANLKAAWPTHTDGVVAMAEGYLALLCFPLASFSRKIRA